MITDHTFSVPLDHTRPGGERIEVFAREVVAADRTGQDLPWLLYLQGGPGFGGPRLSGQGSWLRRGLQDFRLLLLDQRGTGRSTPANRHTLAHLSPRDQAAYLSLFRADSIVRDAELIRPQITDGQPWSVLGQSFGGFCAVTYLSYAPEGLREAFICGGLPGITAGIDDVYLVTYPRMRARSLAHYERYPADADMARQVARLLAGGEVRRPDGGLLTVEEFQSAGRILGSATGDDDLHYLLENAVDGGQLSDGFHYGLQNILAFAGAPLYGLLHEACYGGQDAATRWSAQRLRSQFAEFAPGPAVDGDAPLLFTGEMIYPWMFEHDPVLSPLREAADILAEWTDWPPLYDQGRLAVNEVPVAAAVYFSDMYVPRELSLPTAEAIGGLRAWVTSEYEHDGLRVSDGGVLDRLIALARGLG